MHGHVGAPVLGGLNGSAQLGFGEGGRIEPISGWEKVFLAFREKVCVSPGFPSKLTTDWSTEIPTLAGLSSANKKRGLVSPRATLNIKKYIFTLIETFYYSFRRISNFLLNTLQIIQRISNKIATATVVFQGITQKEVVPESVIPPSSLAKLRLA